ncbi:Leucine-rich repeat,Leucine-rich repeat domain, L domain-like [Cinara cedri]|uniref:Leucine-rich repeat,Leucine-rich repeat domain, L domain-like n=1 Tax=Cinara cedri TaxID=506608 RepID=A0A5E4MMB7_9HEMI|nr:Leucine-rich repeat,Leucine-rich repeat domain, L domain-like [Cinara cedri]
MVISHSLIQEIGYFVRYLYLDNNNIRTLPNELFINCKQLLWLDLRCNRVRQLPDGIKEHQNLQVLLLGKNDIMQLPITLGSLPKLRELQVTGNPLDYPDGNTVKKGSKYLIRFLQEKWKNSQSNSKIIQFDNEINTMITSKSLLMERYSWPMIFLTNWNSDHLVTDRDIRIKELERLFLEKQKIILEKQEKLLQSYKNDETLKVWRDKAKQLQLFENSYKLKNYRGLDIPFGVSKEFSKMMSRETYRKESIGNIDYKKTFKSTAVKPFDFDLEMSDIYKVLTDITISNMENNNKDEINLSKPSIIDLEIQKLHNIQKRIAQLKSHIK